MEHNNDRSIIESIQNLSGNKGGKAVIADCSVISVNEEERNCICQLIEGKADNQIIVSLMTAIDDGILLLPAVGSTIKAAFSDFNSPFAVQYSELEKIVLRGGDLGGMVKVIELTDALNLVERKLNDLITKYNSHIHILTLSAGTGTAAVTATTETPVTETTRADIENTKILQG